MEIESENTNPMQEQLMLVIREGDKEYEIPKSLISLSVEEIKLRIENLTKCITGETNQEIVDGIEHSIKILEFTKIIQDLVRSSLLER